MIKQLNENLSLSVLTNYDADCRLRITFDRNAEKLGGHQLCFGDKISEIKATLILKNQSSFPDMAPMSVCLKILQMKSLEQNFLGQFYMSGSIKQIKTTGKVSLSKFNL